jgi:imidazole glycerol-phosphate synthase subunit HisF
MKPRVIPCLLLKEDGMLYKSVQFKNHKYVGDPINAVRIFNEKEVDELILIDIDARRTKREPNFKRIQEVAEECFMPLCYGGGVVTNQQVDRLFEIGVEKIAFNRAVSEFPQVIQYTVEKYGSQAAVGVVDVGIDFFKKKYFQFGNKKVYASIKEVVSLVSSLAVGEVLVQFIYNDGKMQGYDTAYIREFAQSLETPVIALGGAGKQEHLLEAMLNGASAVACGSFFVFQGTHRAVLITYPNVEEINKMQPLLNREVEDHEKF